MDDEAGERAETKELSSNSSSNTNVNMASALTHVGGDSLRTGAVFVAASVARYSLSNPPVAPYALTLTPTFIAFCSSFFSLTDFNPTLCDAWAAVVVTITILFLIGPLLKEIGKAHSRLANEKIILSGEQIVLE